MLLRPSGLFPVGLFSFGLPSVEPPFSGFLFPGSPFLLSSSGLLMGISGQVDILAIGVANFSEDRAFWSLSFEAKHPFRGDRPFKKDRLS